MSLPLLTRGAVPGKVVSAGRLLSRISPLASARGAGSAVRGDPRREGGDLIALSPVPPQTPPFLGNERGRRGGVCSAPHSKPPPREVRHPAASPSIVDLLFRLCSGPPPDPPPGKQAARVGSSRPCTFAGSGRGRRTGMALVCRQIRRSRGWKSSTPAG